MTDPNNKKLLNGIEKALTVRAENQFRPTNEQKRAKSQFWTTIEKQSVPDISAEPNRSVAALYGSDDRIPGWWSTPGFADWFWNRNEFQEGLDYLAHVCLTSLEAILTSGTSSDNSKVSAAKLILEASKKIGKQDTAEQFDEKVARMSRAELEEYITKSMKLVTPVDK